MTMCFNPRFSFKMTLKRNYVLRVIFVALMVLNISLAQILTSLEFKLREEQEQGAYVGNVGIASRLAMSLPEYEFSRLKFNLPDSKYFRVNEKNGSLVSAVRIDREAICDGELVCKLTFEIVVYTRIDAGSYDILKVIAVSVQILDINDNSPEFPSGMLNLTIPESRDLDQVLRVPSAVDRDTGDNTVKQYSFRDSTDTFKLTVHRNPDGSSYLGIVVKESLDREAKDFYQLVIIATDGGIPRKSGVVVINITVTDVNDNSPEFAYASYNTSVFENMELNIPIMKVEATDRDAGKNAEISYQFSSRVSTKIRQMFYIDEQTGEIFAQNNLDYEEDKLFQFIVEAKDHGTPQFTARASVNLHVIDVNDNAPQLIINLPPTGAEVSENDQVGKFIAHVSALDNDSGRNSIVTCSMNDDHFSLTTFSDHVSNRYKVILAQTLDYEQISIHRVVITCTDMGDPPLSNSTIFVVSVIDVNDNRPAFLQSAYYETVMENQEGEMEVLEVAAHDWDSGDLGKVSYFLEDKYTGHFSIGRSTGILKVLHALDRESNPRYEFYVIARDNGPERLSSSALIVITVDDENDEPPRFRAPLCFGDILENQPPGTPAGTASAIDPDTPANAKMSYSILKHGVDYSNFSIDPTTGVIRSRAIFDRELKQQYQFIVRVVDPTNPEFFSTCNFTVRLQDDNDHAPVIRMSADDNTTFLIQYSASVGSVITTLHAYDADEIPPLLQSGLTFHIQKGDPNQLFEINRYTGSLTLARAIASEDFGIYNLVVVAEDNGEPPRFDSKQLTIKVNGTIPLASEGGLGHNILIVVILVCITVVLAVVTSVTIVLVKRFDRQRRRNRASHKNCEEKMYQLDKKEVFCNMSMDNLGDPNNSNRRSKKEVSQAKLLGSSTQALANGGVNIPGQPDKQNQAPRALPDEECRLIEILKNNAGEASGESDEDTDPSDSGRGCSEDESSHRGSGIDPEHPGNKLNHHSYRGAHATADHKRKPPYQHQNSFSHPTKTAAKMAASSASGSILRQPGTSRRSLHGSVTSDIDSDFSGSRASQSRPDLDRSVSTSSQNMQHSGNRETSGMPTGQNIPFQSRDEHPSRRLSDESQNRLANMKDANSATLSFRGQQHPACLQVKPPSTNRSSENLGPAQSDRSYVAPVGTFRYTSKYPLSKRWNSPSLPEEDDRTTTSGSYVVNTDDLKHDLDALVLHDTVV